MGQWWSGLRHYSFAFLPVFRFTDILPIPLLLLNRQDKKIEKTEAGEETYFVPTSLYLFQSLRNDQNQLQSISTN